MVCAGGLSQDQRLEAMSKLKQYQCRVLISTDLVRGTHIFHCHPSPALWSLSLSLNVLLTMHFILCTLLFSCVSDIQRYRCRESQLGHKSGCATGLGNVHAPDWTGWTLRLVSSIISQTDMTHVSLTSHGQ